MVDVDERLARAVIRCAGIHKQLQKAREEWELDKENKSKMAKVEVERYKHLDCLTYMACPGRWKYYAQCWKIHVQNMQQFPMLQQVGPEFACQYERQILLEQCVGNLVSGQVRAAEMAVTGADDAFETDQSILD